MSLGEFPEEFRQQSPQQSRQESDDEGTWITGDMAEAYVELHRQGHAHSVECYKTDELVGGLYGVSIGKLFFGESMFHHVTDASKIAFAHLMQMMATVGCPLVDCQLPNPHLASLGTVAIDKQTFRNILEEYISAPAIDWGVLVGEQRLWAPI